MKNILLGTGIVGLMVFVFIGILVAVVGFVFIGAFIADFIYSGIFETPDSGAPQITYWMWVGVFVLVRLVLPAGRPTLTLERK